MPKNDELILASTTDTEEQINAALADSEEAEAEEGEAAEEKEGAEEQPATKTAEEKEGTKEESEESKEKSEETEKASESESEEEAEEEEETESEPAVASKGKGRGVARMQKRLEKVTKRLREAEARLAKMQDGEEGETEEAEEEDSKAKPVSTDRPKRATFKTQEEYEDALLTWNDNRRSEESNRKAVDTQRRKEYDTFLETRTKFIADHPDFDEVYDDASEAGITIPEAVQIALIQSNRPDLAYELAKDPAFCKKLVEINETSPTKALLGRHSAAWPSLRRPLWQQSWAV